MPMQDAPHAPPARRIVARLRGFRHRVRSTPVGLAVWRGVVTLLGVAVIAIGIVLLAIPGPGWLVIFAGLGILATEYHWARRLLRFARAQVARWTRWVAERGRVTQVIIGVFGLIVLGAIIVAGWWLFVR
jgi:uncharacterized protein (TIGR02611 family)